MARARSSSGHSKGYKRLFNSFRGQTSFSSVHRSSYKKIFDEDFSVHVRRNRKLNRAAGGRTFRSAFGVFIPVVSHSKAARKGAADFQPASSQRLLRPQIFSFDKPRQGSKFFAGRRFPGKIGSVSSLLPYSNKGRASKISLLCLQKESVSNDVSPVRAVECTLDFLPHKQLAGRSSSYEGNSCSSLSRRFSVSPSRGGDLGEAIAVRSKPVPRVRLEDKFGEVNPESSDVSRVSGHRLEHQKKRDEPSRRKDSAYINDIAPVDKQRQVELGIRKVLNRQVRLRIASDSTRTSFFETSSAGKQVFARDPTKKALSLAKGSPCRLSVVDEEFINTGQDFSRRTNDVLVNGCVGHRLGLSHGRDPGVRCVDAVAEELAHQQERDVHRPYSREEIEEIVGGKVPDGTIGQQDGYSLPEESRGDEIESSFGSDERGTPVDSHVKDFSVSLFSSRSLQHNGRSAVERHDSSRLASTDRGDIDDFCQVGNATNRFVCVESVESRPELCDNRCRGFSGSIHQRVQQTLEVQVGMGVPTTSSHSEGSASSQQVIGNLHSSCPALGECVLESRSEEQSRGGSDTPKELVPVLDRSVYRSASTQGGRPSFGGLEGTGWTPLISDLLAEDVDLLQSAWRESTLKTYNSAWRQWRSWCKQSGVRSDKPSASEICSYLSFLFRVKKLALSTILVHKSVVVSLSSPENGERLSAHPLIKSILKAISLKVSTSSVPRSHIWNVLDLVEWLKSHPPDPYSIFQISRHTAALLLLASGRRVHDLTLISLDKDHCQLSDSVVTFWPRFGSKTDNNRNRQSGWELRSSGDHLLDLVKWVHHLIQVSAPRRRAQENLSALFITTRGKVRAASRTVIAGWFKEPFKDLGIALGPGSIRSAVASFDFQNNVSLDLILEKGNWHGSGNFFKHYCKTVQKPSTHTGFSLRRSFKAV